MKGFIVLTKNDDSLKISAIEGELTIADAIEMCMAGQKHFTNLLVQQSQKLQDEAKKEGD